MYFPSGVFVRPSLTIILQDECIQYYISTSRQILMSLYLVIKTRVRVEIRMNEKCSFSHVITGCPKSSFLYFISLYSSTIGLGKQIISTEVVSFNIIHYFHTCCAIFWLEYSICVLPRKKCGCASIFSSHIFFVFHSPNCSNSFLVFCKYHER